MQDSESIRNIKNTGKQDIEKGEEEKLIKSKSFISLITIKLIISILLLITLFVIKYIFTDTFIFIKDYYNSSPFIMLKEEEGVKITEEDGI